MRRVSSFVAGVASLFKGRGRQRGKIGEHELPPPPKPSGKARRIERPPRGSDPDFHEKKRRRKIARASRQYNRRRRSGKRARQ